MSILLESGTGELEVIEFKVNNQLYCINVIKTREIVCLEKVNKAVLASKEILGLTVVRDQILTVIDLSYVLNQKETVDPVGKLALICEFNKQHVVFVVDEVVGIRRVQWSEIRKPDDLIKTSLTIGTILDGNKISVLLDYEKIITDLSSDESNVYVKAKNEIDPKKERAAKTLFVAEDSKTIRGLLQDFLTTAGYKIKFFEDGQEAFDALMQIKATHQSNYKACLDLLITDIEMPNLDGHTLTRRLKEDNDFKDLPIIIFSSLITDDLKHKGEQVGANHQISKPEIDQLIKVVDKLLELE